MAYKLASVVLYTFLLSTLKYVFYWRLLYAKLQFPPLGETVLYVEVRWINTVSFFNFVDRFFALRFTVTGAPPAASAYEFFL
jgi:hypothetical protein